MEDYEPKIKKSIRWVRKRKNINSVISKVVDPGKRTMLDEPEVLFMAGSPGAGKTEVAGNANKLIQKELKDGEYVHLDPDELRKFLDEYDGSNAHLFQNSVSIMLDDILSFVRKSKFNVIVDGTLANRVKAHQNITHFIKAGYKVGIIYVYQEPELAWEFTQAREKTDGRKIKKADFIRAFFAAAENVNSFKKEFHDKIELIVVKKNFANKIEKLWINPGLIDDCIKISYSKQELEEKLNEEKF